MVTTLEGRKRENNNQDLPLNNLGYDVLSTSLTGPLVFNFYSERFRFDDQSLRILFET